ncbi:MAG: tRNA pseudouridine(55) synthase TruB [Candidatus Kerfeldbacteria bacterium CG_4_10_14_0_8_um_filter_42_10]|uniref:tRNA pseudouridine synthase B n=1 Tax=Candidatus Kerfeldbacteria bacterium CG_4_10_14_0_8_um_filter_42_10 TaxID=2014248 RepID=A0A2M7RGR1_9BACT|nr:MAG: tRNA pseudouridine(55) synthase TruB [Candidatus Kerfeldbacteria bacterium CG_4_10_14_0_8_um_filter_42_10]
MTNDILAIYKPKGPTSHDIINQLRKITGVKKIGHAGTLDPLARGVLVVGIGREATKCLNTIVQKEKEYIATIKLGEESATDDQEGTKKKVKVVKKPALSEIKKVVNRFQGEISQKPPIYSAVKIKGKKAYQLARRGKQVDLKFRQVEIKAIEILQYRWPYLKLRTVTGPGVYIRSLARDIGSKLKTGGFLADLERTRVGSFTKEKSLSLEELSNG